MRMLTTEEIDRELESRTKEVAAMSSTLLELENHDGLEHVRLYPPTGLTAKRWEVIEPSLAQLWQDLSRMTSILESARMVRARRSKPEDEERRELWAALAQLSPRCQQLLRIVAFVPRPDYDAVAAGLGIPRGSVGPTRGRCLAKLRAILLEGEEGSPDEQPGG